MPPGFVEIVFEIHFHYGDLVTTPLNLGPLPLLVLDLADVDNLLSASVSVLQPGTAPEGFDFPEQKISIDATAEEMSALTGELAQSRHHLPIIPPPSSHHHPTFPPSSLHHTTPLSPQPSPQAISPSSSTALLAS